MKITAIHLAGTIEADKVLPRAYAQVSRTGRHIEITILRPGNERKHMVDADSEEDIRSMAECLQLQLDGYPGTNSEIQDYVRVLERFAN